MGSGAEPASTPPTALANAQSVVEIIGTTVTAVAVIIGAIWAYYKFVKGRTFRQRLKIEAEAAWIEQGKHLFIHCSVALSNIGASQFDIVQEGTALRVFTLESPTSDPSGTIVWKRVETAEIFARHSWIEPAEKIIDDVLVRPLNGDEKRITKLETRVVVRRRRKNLEINQTFIAPTTATIDKQDDPTGVES